MKLKICVAALLALALTSCKEETKTEKTKEAKVQTEATTDTVAGGETVADSTGVNADIDTSSALLRLNYPKGFKQQLSYVMNTKAQGMNMDMAMEMTMDVVSVKAGENPVFGINAEINSMKMATNAMGQKMNYDSSLSEAKMGPEEKAMHGQMKQMINQPISMSLDSRGKIVGEMKFKNADASQQPLDLSSYQVPYPKDPVKVGDTWTQEIANKQYGGKLKSTYTVKQITATEVELGLKAVIPPMQGNPKETTLTGGYTIDRATGMVLRGSMGGKMPMMNSEIKMVFTGKKL